MKRYWKYLATGILALAVFVPAASARPVVVFRSGFYGPGWGWYGPAYYGWYGPGYYYGPYESVPTSGQIKIDIKMKDAQVYVDGGYAGLTRDLKTFPLKPGEHDIELRSPSGQTILQEHVQVLAGKTIKLTP